MTEDSTDYDPFNAPLDVEEEQETLVASLRMLRGFGLFFAVTNSATERNRRMDAVESQVIQKKIQRVAVNTETENLLWHLREVLTDPKPGGVFVYGLENWISGAVRPRSIPFLLNLNAARDTFPFVLPAPMVIWVPQYVLRAIADAAPDFFSVRSGVYTFPISSDERFETSRDLVILENTTIQGLTVKERTSRRHAIEGMLSEYRNLPDAQRDMLAEAALLDKLGTYQRIEGDANKAEEYYTEAYNIRRNTAPGDYINLATSLNNLASTYQVQKRYNEAEKLFTDSINMYHSYLPPNNWLTATALDNLAQLFRQQNRLDEAKEYHLKSLNMRRSTKPKRELDIATSLNNLGGLYLTQRDYEGAVTQFEEALKISLGQLQSSHPNIALISNNLGRVYELQGRVTEAKRSYIKAVSKAKVSLGDNHPTTKLYVENLNRFLTRVQDDITRSRSQNGSVSSIVDSFLDQVKRRK